MIDLPPSPPRIVGDAPRLALHDEARVRAAAHHARRVLPGPVGELVDRELLAAVALRCQMGSDALIARLVQHVLARPATPVHVDEEEHHVR